ncbi:hypothetical protein [Salipaludibacillus daqingensis]|uniref:hypothetical protein n=1 Tax=Salipaludibacillus daqingensis TaxID=3041001 RepID=UPI0024733396|nr:hypothetical protein [Salipaludibacillus daqingensis]
MKALATHPYYKVRREINSIEQKNVEYERTLYLYEDKLITQHREFPADKVFDMSYRELKSGEEGTLFIHTSQGVFTYIVKEDPAEFIEAFKELEKKLLHKKDT